MVFICLFYFALAVIGLGLVFWRRNELYLFDPLAFSIDGCLVYLTLSVSIIFIVHFLSRWSVGRWPSLKQSARELNHWLGEMKNIHIFVIALVSGVGEEIIFRGWLLNEIGLIYSSLIFGVVHWPPNRNWRFWPFFAFSMGIILGLLCVWTNSLVYAIVVHGGINYLNLSLLPKIVNSEEDEER
jgi:hypothetical protein